MNWKFSILLTFTLLFFICPYAYSANTAKVTTLESGVVKVTDLYIQGYKKGYDHFPICWKGSNSKLKISEVSRIIFLQPGKYHRDDDKVDGCEGFRVDVKLKDGTSEKMSFRDFVRSKSGTNEAARIAGTGQFGSWKLRIRKISMIEINEDRSATTQHQFPDDYKYNPYTGERL